MRIIKAEMKKVSVEVDTFIKKIISLKNPDARQIQLVMKYATLSPGKRFRPFLVLESAKIFNVDRKLAIQVAASVELVHAYSLVHDDLPCMDNDIYRRGILSTHAKFGESMALLSGNALLVKAFEILASEKFKLSHKVKCQLIDNLTRSIGVEGLILGQEMDLKILKNKKKLSWIKDMQRLKTGSLIKFSCVSGAIISTASRKKFSIISKFADKLGMLYQITDDLIDEKNFNDRNKLSIVNFLGRSKAEQLAKSLSSECTKILNPFGRKAEILIKVPRFILERKY